MVGSINIVGFNKLLKRLDKLWRKWPLLMHMGWDRIITIDLNVKT
jgi:SPX domain protein involved in polyphosphate accumulation